MTDRENRSFDKERSLLSMSIEEKKGLINESTGSQKYETQASPKVWVPLSLMVAVLYAVGNVSSSAIAKYRLKARALQSIGTIVGNLTPLILVSIYDRAEDKSVPRLKWFYDIYFYRAKNSNGETIENKWTNKLYWERVRASMIMMLHGAFVQYFFFLSYNWANIAGLNNGVLMSLYSVKPIITSIMFYIVFNQTLK